MTCKSYLIKYSSLALLTLFCSTDGQAWKKDGATGVDSAEKNMTGKDHALNGLVVTGQYAPNTVEKATHKIRVIDRQKIDVMNAQNLRDVLTNELNIRISQDNVLGSGMSLQGISGQNVKILIDGVPVIGRMEGNIDLSQINLNNIERIEIIEGPMSVNYGTDALAGTINLITKKTQSKQVEGNLTSYYESVGTYNINGRAGFKQKGHMVSVTGGRYFFDGWTPGDKQFDLNFSEKTADTLRYKQWKPKEQYFGDLQYGYTFRNNLSVSYRGGYFQEKITNRGMPRLPYGENALDDNYHTYRVDNAVFMNADIAENKKLNVQAAYNHYKRIRNTYAKDLTTLEEVLSVTPGDQDTSRYNQFNSRGTFSTSDADHKLNYELGYDINMEYATGERITGKEQRLNDYALFASAEYKPVKSLTFRPGLRYAYNTGYNAPVIPSIHFRSQPVKDFTIRASYARGFRAPTLKELHFEFVDVNHNILGNTDLKPEYSDNYNASLSYLLRRSSMIWKFEGAVFYNDIRNQITLAETGPNAEYSYINIGINKTNGAQLHLETQIKKLKAGIGGAYIGRYNHVASEAPQVTTFSYAPELRGSVMYEFEQPGITAAAFYKYTGRLPGFVADVNGNITATDIDPYHIADVTLSKTFLEKKLNFSLGCKNIFDVQNVNRLAAGASGGAHSSGGGSIPVGTGRTYFMRLIVNINSLQ